MLLPAGFALQGLRAVGGVSCVARAEILHRFGRDGERVVDHRQDDILLLGTRASPSKPVKWFVG